jgi:hypothetical protein
VQCGTAARYLPPSTACHAGTLHVRHGKPPVHQTDLRPVPAPTKPQYVSCASSHAARRGRQKYCLFASGTAPGDVSPRIPVRYVHLFRGPCHMTNTGLFIGQEQGGNYNTRRRPAQESLKVEATVVLNPVLVRTAWWFWESPLQSALYIVSCSSIDLQATRLELGTRCNLFHVLDLRCTHHRIHTTGV